MSEHLSQERPTFTPLVLRHRERVTAALRAMLGVQEHIPFQWRQEGAYTDDGWSLVLLIGQGRDRVEIELSAAQVARPAFFNGRVFHAAHRALPVDRPELWEAIVRRVRALDRGGRPELLQELLAAQRAYAPFAAREDEDFRSYAQDEALLRIGFRCNQDCSFCWQGRRWPEADLATLERWLDEMVARGARRVVLSGGEPTVYMDKLLPLARRARFHHNVMTLIQTNAIRLSKPEVLASLQEAGVGGALISYHSADAEVSDAMTRAPGTHAKTERGIRAALEAGLLVDLNVVVERRTLPGLVERSKHIVQNFLPLATSGMDLVAGFSFPTDYFDPEIFTHESVPLDEVAGPLAEAIAILKGAGVVVSAVGTCGFPLCVLADIPEAIDLSVWDGFDMAHLRSREFPEVCATCGLRSVCVGPRREYMERHGVRGLRPFTEIPAVLEAELGRRDKRATGAQ